MWTPFALRLRVGPWDCRVRPRNDIEVEDERAADCRVGQNAFGGKDDADMEKIFRAALKPGELFGSGSPRLASAPASPRC